VTPVVNRLSYGRTMRDLNTVNIVGVAKKPLIVTVHRNQTIIKSTWLSVCRNCHDHIHNNPAEARILGWLK